MPFRHMRAKGGASLGRWLRNAVSQLVPRSSSSTSSGSVTGTDQAILERPTLLQQRQQHQQYHASPPPPSPQQQQKQTPLPLGPCPAQPRLVTRKQHSIGPSNAHQYWHDRTSKQMQRVPSFTATLPKPSIRAFDSSLLAKKLSKPSSQASLSTLRKLESVPESSAEEANEHFEHEIRQGNKNNTTGICNIEPMSTDSGAPPGSMAPSSQLSSSDSALLSSTIQRRRQHKDWSHREEVCRSLSYHCPFLYDHYLDEAGSDDEEVSSTLTLMHDDMEVTEWPDEPLEFPIGEGGPRSGPELPLTQKIVGKEESTQNGNSDLPSPSRHSAGSTEANSSDHTAHDARLSPAEKEEIGEIEASKKEKQNEKHRSVSLETIDDVFSHAVASFPLPPHP